MLLNMEKPFQLFVQERRVMAAGVMTQMLGSWKDQWPSFPNETSKGCLSCLRAIAVTALVVQEARKLILGQPLMVFVPHAVLAVMESKGN